jgi:ABC-type uncharacterized transport system substrate-binding protein
VEASEVRTDKISADHQSKDHEGAWPDGPEVIAGDRQRGDRMMRRREFITLLGAAAWPLAARAQQAAMPIVGFLNSATPEGYAPMATAFGEGLKQTGYFEGQNVAIEFRWADGHYDRLPELATELVRRQVAVIAGGGPPAALAAKAATSTIPIVFTSGTDPVKLGLVSSFNRPGGNITGVHLFLSELNTKKLGLLRDLLPQAKAIGVLLNPTAENAEPQWRAAGGRTSARVSDSTHERQQRSRVRPGFCNSCGPAG